MTSPIGDRAIKDALAQRKALLKFISPNDAGLTNSHQCGFYLPKGAWKLYTPNAPAGGANNKHDVQITWPDGMQTDSVVTWYGTATRSEYRLTRFGRDFVWLTDDAVGDLLVYIPTGPNTARAYVLDSDDDIEDVQAALGVFISGSWAIYEGEGHTPVDTGSCLATKFREFCSDLTSFPSGQAFSVHTRDSLTQCMEGFLNQPVDKVLIDSVRAEYRLFQMAERLLLQNEITQLFKSIDEFLEVATSILQRRKVRAGQSFENHISFILNDNHVPHSVRPNIVGEPDIVIPGVNEYNDPSYPVEKLIVLAAKRTCKDRWRQVLTEAPRVVPKHIITIQEGISSKQLVKMKEKSIQLVVPAMLHDMYPSEWRENILSVREFIDNTHAMLKI